MSAPLSIPAVAAGAAIGTSVETSMGEFGERLEDQGFKEPKERELDVLKDVRAYLHQLVSKFVLDQELGNLEEVAVLAVVGSGPEVAIRKKGRKYVALFTPVAINVTFNVRGIGVYAPAVPAGWSYLAMPDQTTAILTSGGPLANVLLLATDDIIGVAI